MPDDVKQNEPVRLTSDRDRDEWLACLQAAAARRENSVPGPTVLFADELYRLLRKRCVR